MENMSMIYDALLEFHAEGILQHALEHYRLNGLREEIDEALDVGDRDLFVKLVREYKNLKMIVEEREVDEIQ